MPTAVTMVQESSGVEAFVSLLALLVVFVIVVIRTGVTAEPWAEGPPPVDPRDQEIAELTRERDNLLAEIVEAEAIAAKRAEVDRLRNELGDIEGGN